MAKFCTKCGKPLEEGKACDCARQITAETQENIQQQPQAEYVSNEEQFQKTQQAVSGFLARVGGAFLNVIKHPVTAGRTMILTGDYQVGVALIVLQGIFSAIFGAVAAGKLYSMYNGLLGGMMSLLGGSSGESVKMPYGKIIIGTMLISIALSFVLALLLMLGNMIIKNNLSYKQMLAAVGSRSCVAVISALVGILFYLINPGIGLLIFCVGNIWGFFIILQAMPISDEGMRDKLPTIIILVYIVFAILTSVCIGKGGRLYVPTDIMEDSTDSLENLFGNYY